MTNRLINIAFGSLILLLFSTLSVKAQDDIKKIKDRVVKELLKSEVSDVEVAKLLENIKADGTWPGINYEDVSRTAFEHCFHLHNMVDLARAYKNKSSTFYKNKKVRVTVELALKNWVNNDYFCENWWYNEIGTPRSLVTLMLIIGNDLDDNLVKKAQSIIGRAHIESSGARPGGDRIKIAGIQAKNMLFLGDNETFEKVVRVIEEEIKFTKWSGNEYGYGFRKFTGGFVNRTSNGRGIQYDYSFHHRVDGVNNTLSYGLNYANAFVEWAVYTRETQYFFSEEKVKELVDYYLNGICKMAIYGKFPDPGAKNRSISREGALDPYNAEVPEKLLLVSDYRNDELQEIIDIRNEGIKPTLSHATYYWDSEHFTFQRPDFFTSVRMYSTRVHNMEWPYNGEGILNYHRGDGVNHISITGDEYYNIWPVYDYQKIPGTTVMQKSELSSKDEVQKLGLNDFVGAATDGKYAAVAFDFKSPHDPLIARKSWFFFDDEYVCLGSGISCKNELSVVTTLNQCLLRSDVTISSGSKSVVLNKGENKFEKVDWVFQDGVGYVFPQPISVNIKNSEATGSWWRINKQSDSPKDEVRLDVFKLWVEHGVNPSNKTYEYIVVPATSIEELETSTSKNNIVILSNTPEVQAVKHLGINMIQAVFYKAGEISLSDDVKLISNTPGVVLLKIEGQKISQITVSDPNRELKKMHFLISMKIEKEGENFKTIWNEQDETSDVIIDLPQNTYAGDSKTIKL